MFSILLSAATETAASDRTLALCRFCGTVSYILYMMATTVSLQEHIESQVTSKTPILERITVNPAQKRNRDDEVGGPADKKWSGWPGDNVFRLVVSLNKVGGIIGRKGEYVRKMSEETKARIKILDGVPGTSERIVMVSAKEDLDAPVSPAMDGLLTVHKRTIDGLLADSAGNHVASGATVSSRLLVAAAQAGSLIGKQGATIKSIQEASSTIVRILAVEDLPLCALADDRMVEIQGEPHNVHKAIELVASHLRKFLVDHSVLPLFEVARAATNQSQGPQRVSNVPWTGSSASTLPSSGLGLRNSSQYASTLNHESYYPAPEGHDSLGSHHGVSLYGRDPSLGCLISSVVAPPPAPVITQVTQHMQVPLPYADAIIGTAGANISYMRRTSGATITIQETPNVPGEMTVEIHGTATQVQTVQQLVQNFMAGASAPPTSSYKPVDTGYSLYGDQSSLYSSTGNAGLTSGDYGSLYSSRYAY